MESIKTHQAVDYAIRNLKQGNCVYGGETGAVTLHRLDTALVLGNGEVIFAREFGTRQPLFFHAANFAIMIIPVGQPVTDLRQLHAPNA